MSSKFYHNKNGVPLKTQDDVINERGSNSIKKMTYNNQRNELLVADRMGNLYIFDYQNFNMLKKISLSNFGIEDIALSPKGGLLGVVLITGESFLCDCSRNYQRVQSLEPSFEDYTIKSTGLYKGIILIQDELERSDLFESISANPNKSVMSERSLKINYRKYYVKSETALKALTIHNSNTIHLQQIYKDDLTISRSVKIEYCIEGKCNGFQVHSSNDYLIVLSNIGIIYVFKLINGEVRLKIDVPSSSKNLILDPSGLYCLISTGNMDDGGIEKTEREFRTTNFFNKELDYVLSKKPVKERNQILLIEIGTGSVVGEISNVFDISSARFSKIGDYLILGSNKGHIGVWTVRDVILDNVTDVLEQMRMNPRFWNDYPIMAQEMENLEYDQLSEASSRVKTDEDSLSYEEIEEDVYTTRRYSKRPGKSKKPFKIGKRRVERPKQSYKRFTPHTFTKKNSSKPRFYEEMANKHKSNRIEISLKGKNDKERRFLRDRNLEENNPYIDTIDYKSRSNLDRFKIDRGTIEKKNLLNHRRAKIAEINKRLDVLSKSRRVDQPFIHNPKDLNQNPGTSDYLKTSERVIQPEPSDIDFDYDNPQNISERDNENASIDVDDVDNHVGTYNEIDQFESKFRKSVN